MPFVIGTAGHIDHGKTSLVRALTGIDTDRLKEEKERGISIDLGFAYLDLPDGTRVGIVDVPGHERFIRNMLAGAHGIDLVLFTVAADDGVMPQTEEHLDIVHVLGIERGIFVITKSDLVAEPRLSEVAEEIRIVTAGTAFEHSPIVPVSATTTQGLDRLRVQLVQTLNAVTRPAPQGYFRLPIDRVFTLQGHGLVATGTALAGAVGIGDRLCAVPGGQTFRVRSVHVHNQPVDRATWGQRVALNLAAQDKHELERGSVLCDERVALETVRFDAFIEARVPATVKLAIRNHQRVRLHLGTAERLAKVVLLDRHDQLGSRQTAFCQITISDRPLGALRGDRFVLRDETATHTLGGGIVLHPLLRVHRRKDRAAIDTLITLRDGAPEAVVECYVDDHQDFATSIGDISRFLNRSAEQTRAIAGAAARLYSLALDGEQIYTTSRKWHALKEGLLDRLNAFHQAHPLAAGQDMEALRERLPWSLSPRVFRACVALLEQQGALAREGGVLRASGHVSSLQSADRQLAERIIAMLRATPLTPPDGKEIERRLSDHPNVRSVIRVLERGGSIIRVSTDLYFLSDTLAELRQALQQGLPDADVLTPGLFRDRFGTSRKYAIPLLEYLDREGITQRVGDVRRLKQPPSAARA